MQAWTYFAVGVTTGLIMYHVFARWAIRVQIADGLRSAQEAILHWQARAKRMQDEIDILRGRRGSP